MQRGKNVQFLIRLRSNDWNAMLVVRDGSRLAASSIFFFFFSFSIIVAVFSPCSSSPGVTLGLICIISPKSAARYDGITLHDSWIWAKAAVRTGYLANVLSRPRSAAQESEREREWMEEEREREREREKKVWRT